MLVRVAPTLARWYARAVDSAPLLRAVPPLAAALDALPEAERLGALDALADELRRSMMLGALSRAAGSRSAAAAALGLPLRTWHNEVARLELAPAIALREGLEGWPTQADRARAAAGHKRGRRGAR